MLQISQKWGVFLPRIALFMIAFFGIVPVALTAPAPSADDLRIERYEGVARDRDGKVLYREKHVAEYRNDRVFKARTQYFSPDGKLAGELESTFPVTPYLPNYRFQNLEAKIIEGVDCCTDGKLVAFHQDQKKSLQYGPNWVSGQGFHYLARDSLKTLDSGRISEFRFLIPSKLGTYAFRIRSEGRDPEAPRLERIRLEIDQWFFRLFAPKITAWYDRETRRLMRYEGPSNLEDQKGRVPTVVIEYTYDPAGPS